jgi:soluble lytic murein transglycosylase-like protein
VRLRSVLVLAALLAGVACDDGTAARSPVWSTTVSVRPVDLRPLLAATREPALANSADLASRLSPAPATNDASWPIHTFLAGEIHRLRGDAAAARTAWRALAEWAAANPYRDGTGGSSLATVALWRWLRALGEDPRPGADEAARLVEVAGHLRIAPLTRGLFEPSALETLPQLEEDLARRLARLAWSLGQREAALRRFLDALALTRGTVLTPDEEDMRRALLASQLASERRLDLLRGKRLLALGRYEEADGLLAAARTSQEADVRSEAGLYLARLERIRDDRKKGLQRGQIAAALATVADETPDPEVAQRALFERAMLLVREGSGRDVDGFRADLTRLLDAYPRGRWADDALYELGMQAWAAGQADAALDHFTKLRGFRGENDWINSAYFRPALALWGRRGPGDLDQAATILRDLNDRQPDGPFRLAAMFWLGRIAAEKGDAATAAAAFRSVIAESPFDYYALRARMHLESGESAAEQPWPGPRTLAEIRAAWQESTPAVPPPPASAYDQRLADAIESGLYGEALAAIHVLRERFPGRRLEWITLDELDHARLLPAIAILLALRQDALTSVDGRRTADQRLAIAAVTGHRAGDWPLAMGLVIATDASPSTRAAMQRSPHYLVTAYPRVFAEAIVRRADARRVSPPLLYSVMRNESLFNPAALSPRGALGLFQFTPSTFDVLSRRHPELLAPPNPTTRESFLLDPERSIDLGALWFGQELVFRRNVVHALMEHNVGYAAVKAWIESGRQRGRASDVEYMVDTFRVNETHVFVRRVVTDTILVDAGSVLIQPAEPRR